MTLSEKLSEYIAACFPALWIQSYEHDDALADIARLCRDEGWRLASWDVDAGLQITGADEADDVRCRWRRPLGGHSIPGCAGQPGNLVALCADELSSLSWVVPRSSRLSCGKSPQASKAARS